MTEFVCASRAGGKYKQLLIEGHTFNINRVDNANKRVYWRCRYYRTDSCRARLQTCPITDQILLKNLQHNHEAPAKKIEIDKVEYFDFCFICYYNDDYCLLVFAYLNICEQYMLLGNYLGVTLQSNMKYEII